MVVYSLHQRCKANDFSFQESISNPLPVTYIKALYIEKSSRVFVPLCGKTPDMSWPISNGYRVSVVELSDLVVKQIFVEHGINPVITDIGEVQHYVSDRVVKRRNSS